jgi:hypothetical protein
MPQSKDYKTLAVALIFVVMIALIYWLGESPTTTRAEPRALAPAISSISERSEVPFADAQSSTPRTATEGPNGAREAKSSAPLVDPSPMPVPVTRENPTQAADPPVSGSSSGSGASESPTPAPVPSPSPTPAPSPSPVPTPEASQIPSHSHSPDPSESPDPDESESPSP